MEPVFQIDRQNPHAPAIIRASTGEFLAEPAASVSNLENMVLVDQTLGKVRSILEADQSWDQTLVVLTSDHWQRDFAGDHLPPLPGKTQIENGLRIPLLVKFPGQTSPMGISQNISNVIIRQWIESLAQGKTYPHLPFRPIPLACLPTSGPSLWNLITKLPFSANIRRIRPTGTVPWPFQGMRERLQT